MKLTGTNCSIGFQASLRMTVKTAIARKSRVNAVHDDAFAKKKRVHGQHNKFNKTSRKIRRYDGYLNEANPR